MEVNQIRKPLLTRGFRFVLEHVKVPGLKVGE